MFDWLATHHQIVNVLANIGMLIVWVAYLQLFISSYRRQRRPNILITRGAGAKLDARCLISNMSADPIYVASIIAALETSDGPMSCPITELVDQEEMAALPDLKPGTRQGPLLTGHIRDIGTFHNLIAHVLQQKGDRRVGSADVDLERLRAVEITVVAVYGSEDVLAGATRRFEMVRDEGGLRLKACTVRTRQIRSRRARKRFSQIVEQDL